VRLESGQSVGWGGHDPAAARQALVAAYEAGIDHWDTADVYGQGRSESLIGEVWREVPRDRIFLASKVGWDPGPYPHPYHPDWVRHQIDASLARLKTDRIDLYYLHHCDFGPGDRHLAGAVEVLREARAAGKIRFIGLSDWDGARLAGCLPSVDPDVIQPHRNVIDDTYASSGLRALVEARDLGVAFFSPIRLGLLLGKYGEPPVFEEGDVRANDAGFRDTALLAALRQRASSLRERLGGQEPVLRGLCGALLEDAPTGCVLLGMRNPVQVRAAAAATTPLTAAEAAWVREQYRGLRAGA
jgi:aryl-alcohol dehydrogenase-like predicted oxidoreductase